MPSGTGVQLLLPIFIYVRVVVTDTQHDFLAQHAAISVCGRQAHVGGGILFGDTASLRDAHFGGRFTSRTAIQRSAIAWPSRSVRRRIRCSPVSYTLLIAVLHRYSKLVICLSVGLFPRSCLAISCRVASTGSVSPSYNQSFPALFILFAT